MNIAVLVGVSEYEFLNNLPACKNDVQLIEEICRSIEEEPRVGKFIENNVHVIIEESQNVATFNGKLESIKKQCLRETVGELLFYYSGHGVQTDKDFYFTVSNTRTEDLQGTALSNTELDDFIVMINPRSVIKVVDACHAAVPIYKEGAGPQVNIVDSSVGILQKTPKESSPALRDVYFFYSSKPDQVSYTGPTYSDFTLSFALALVKRNNNFVISCNEIMNFVRKHSMKGAGPAYIGQGTQDLPFGLSSDELNARVAHSIVTHEANAQALSGKPILCFDEDGTVLNRNEIIERGSAFLDHCKFFVERGYHIAFITGNESRRQRERILVPLIEAGLEESISFFCDGGSLRLLHIADGFFYQDKEYSADAIIENSKVETIKTIFASCIGDFFETPSNQRLKWPDAREIGRDIDKYGQLQLLVIEFGPLNKASFEGPIANRLCSHIDVLIDEYQPRSKVKVSKIERFIQIRFEGIDAEDDWKKISPDLKNVHLFFKSEKDREVSRPELEVCGSGDKISQLAIKPFNRSVLRKNFLDMFERRMQKQFGDEYSVNLGGRTTIDVQRKNVSKRKAIKKLQALGANSERMVFFGDEFCEHGNDRLVAVAVADAEYHPPTTIVDVGTCDADSTPPKGARMVHVDHGVRGTMDCLELMRRSIELTAMT